jgi:hypothetical protein
MKKTIHTVNFIALVAVLSLLVVLFFRVNGNPTLQVAIGILLPVLYVTWGILHHAFEKTLHPKIVVEYLLVGAIALILILTVAWT